MRYVIEEAFNVGLDNVVDRLEHDRIVDGLKRLMTTALSSPLKKSRVLRLCIDIVFPMT